MGREDSAKLLYMCISVDGDHTENKENADIHIDVPIVILQSYNESYTPKGEAYAFLKEFNNLEQVIMDFGELGYDKDEVLGAIREYAPNAEIYEVKNVNGVDHLEKCP